jgi:hypothetical protein
MAMPALSPVPLRTEAMGFSRVSVKSLSSDSNGRFDALNSRSPTSSCGRSEPFTDARYRATLERDSLRAYTPIKLSQQSLAPSY